MPTHHVPATFLRRLSTDDALADAILAELRIAPDGLSLPRLCKRLDVRMSVLLRALAWLGEERIGGLPGAGLVRIVSEGTRDIAMLTDAGHRHADKTLESS